MKKVFVQVGSAVEKNVRAPVKEHWSSVVSRISELKTDPNEHLRAETLEAINIQKRTMKRAKATVVVHFFVCALIYTVFERENVQVKQSCSCGFEIK